MSKKNKKDPNEVAEDVVKDQTVEFTVAKFGGKYVRLSSTAVPPEGTELFTHEDVDNPDSMSLEKLGQVYGVIAGVAPKKYKDRAIAVQSVLYQVRRLIPTDPWAPIARNLPPGPKDPSTKPVKSGNKKTGPVNLLITLLTPADSVERLKKLAPQARNLVSIMADYAQLKSTVKFNSAQVEEMMAAPDVVQRLATRQPPMRIFTYYKNDLENSGFIKIDKVFEAPKKEEAATATA